MSTASERRAAWIRASSAALRALSACVLDDVRKERAGFSWRVVEVSVDSFAVVTDADFEDMAGIEEMVEEDEAVVFAWFSSCKSLALPVALSTNRPWLGGHVKYYILSVKQTEREGEEKEMEKEITDAYPNVLHRAIVLPLRLVQLDPDPRFGGAAEFGLSNEADCAFQVSHKHSAADLYTWRTA